MPAWMREQQANNMRFGLGALEPEEDRGGLAEEASINGDATDRRSWPRWMRRQRRANRRLRLRDDAYGLTVFLAENSDTSSGSESSNAGEIIHGALDVGLIEVRPPQERCFANEPALSLEDSFAALDQWGTSMWKADEHDEDLKNPASSNSFTMSYDSQSPGAGNVEGRRRRYGLPRLLSMASASSTSTSSTVASESDWDASNALRVQTPAPKECRFRGGFQRSGRMAAEDRF